MQFANEFTSIYKQSRDVAQTLFIKKDNLGLQISDELDSFQDAVDYFTSLACVMNILFVCSHFIANNNLLFGHINLAIAIIIGSFVKLGAFLSLYINIYGYIRRKQLFVLLVLFPCVNFRVNFKETTTMTFLHYF